MPCPLCGRDRNLPTFEAWRSHVDTCRGRPWYKNPRILLPLAARTILPFTIGAVVAHFIVHSIH